MPSARFLLSSAALLAGTVCILSGINLNPAKAENSTTKRSDKAHIDLAFCIDTTGSMQGEIDAVKSKTREIVAKLAGSKPAPEVRVGLVAYRDRGDAYVTKVFQFDGDIDKVVKDISSLEADGGGDEPEAVNQALHDAVTKLDWSKEKKTVKMLFLIGDAGPNHYNGDFSWEKESRDAIARGIQINTIGCGGLNGEGQQVFEKIAKLADGQNEFLTYRQEIVDAHGKRSTVLSSAGRTYSLDAKAASDWRSGASTLMAKGVAAPMPAAPSARPIRAKSMYMGAPAARSAMAGAGGSADGFDSYGGGASFSRTENNLADIVLKATKDAARKKASLEYKD